MAAQRIPGLALGIVKDDRIAYLRGFGKADDSGRAVTPQTPFIIGSLSKSFTALAIMQLVEAGKVELDAPVQRYLPWFRVADEEASARITVRHLLNHTSGLSTKTGRSYQGNGDTSDAALEKAVRKLSSAELTAPVGETYQYSTINYSVLGLIVQTVAGRSYESYVQTRDPRPAADARLVYLRGRRGAAGPRDRLPLLVRQAQSGRSAVQPRARPGRLPDLQRRGHDPLPDRPAERRSVRHGVGAVAGRSAASSTGRPSGRRRLAPRTAWAGSSVRSTGSRRSTIRARRSISTRTPCSCPQSRKGVVVLMNAENSLDLFLNGRMGTISEGVTSLLEGREPSSPPSSIASSSSTPLLFGAHRAASCAGCPVGGGTAARARPRRPGRAAVAHRRSRWH